MSDERKGEKGQREEELLEGLGAVASLASVALAVGASAVIAPEWMGAAAAVAGVGAIAKYFAKKSRTNREMEHTEKPEDKPEGPQPV